jgi:hypothetical protein
MANQTTARTDLFQHLVLQGLWVIILILLKKDASNQTAIFRGGAVGFGDTYGAKGEDALMYRRDVTYKW